MFEMILGFNTMIKGWCSTSVILPEFCLPPIDPHTFYSDHQIF